MARPSIPDEWADDPDPQVRLASRVVILARTMAASDPNMTETDRAEFTQAVADQVHGQGRTFTQACEIVADWWMAGVPLETVDDPMDAA